jgi:hypothetical protein
MLITVNGMHAPMGLEALCFTRHNLFSAISSLRIDFHVEGTFFMKNVCRRGQLPLAIAL